MFRSHGTALLFKVKDLRCILFAKRTGLLTFETMPQLERPIQLTGSIYSYHPAARGSNPKYNIDDFKNLQLNCGVKRTKINEKSSGWVHILKNNAVARYFIPTKNSMETQCILLITYLGIQVTKIGRFCTIVYKSRQPISLRTKTTVFRLSQIGLQETEASVGGHIASCLISV